MVVYKNYEEDNKTLDLGILKDFGVGATILTAIILILFGSILIATISYIVVLKMPELVILTLFGLILSLILFCSVILCILIGKIFRGGV